MKCAQPDARGLGPEQFLHARAHLLGGLVGEGDRHDMVGWHIHRPNQVGNAVGKHPGLAGTRPSQNQGGACRCGYSRLLLGVEQIEEVFHGMAIVPQRLARAWFRRIGMAIF